MSRSTTMAWASTGAFALLSLYLLAELRAAERKQPYLPSDAKAIELARRAFIAETGGDRPSTTRGRFPVVMRFGGVRCVALKVQRGYLGRTPVYCFDMDYRRVTAIDTRSPEVVDTRETSYQPPVRD
jgi:hypothetical protein